METQKRGFLPELLKPNVVVGWESGGHGFGLDCYQGPTLIMSMVDVHFLIQKQAK